MLLPLRPATLTLLLPPRPPLRLGIPLSPAMLPRPTAVNPPAEVEPGTPDPATSGPTAAARPTGAALDPSPKPPPLAAGTENDKEEESGGDDNDDDDNTDNDDTDAGEGSGAEALSACAGPGVGRRAPPPALVGLSYNDKGARELDPPGRLALALKS